MGARFKQTLLACLATLAVFGSFLPGTANADQKTAESVASQMLKTNLSGDTFYGPVFSEQDLNGVAQGHTQTDFKGVRDLTVVRMKVPGMTKLDTATVPLIEARVRQIAGDFAKTTDGVVQFQLKKVTEWVEFNQDCSDAAALWRHASTAAGFTPGPGKHLLVWLPAEYKTINCRALGLGQVDGWLTYVASPEFSRAVIIHELGHNLGLRHSGGVLCDQPVADDPHPDGKWSNNAGCKLVTYGDVYDVMGAMMGLSDFPGFNGANLQRLGSRLDQHSEVTAPKVVSVNGFDQPNSTDAKKYPTITSKNGVKYILEYWQPHGNHELLNARPLGKGGVLVRRTTSVQSGATDAQVNSVVGQVLLNPIVTKRFVYSDKFVTPETGVVTLGDGVKVKVTDVTGPVAKVEVAFGDQWPSADPPPAPPKPAGKGSKLVTLTPSVAGDGGTPSKKSTLLTIAFE